MLLSKNQESLFLIVAHFLTVCWEMWEFWSNPCFIFLSSIRIADQNGTKQRAPLIVPSKAYAAESSSAVRSLLRFRLNNLGPQPGATKQAKRKGRGHSAGQGGSCGFGMRGQKSRSGPGVQKGFEGCQMPLYRRIPKLRGVAAGVHWIFLFHFYV